MNSLVSKT